MVVRSSVENCNRPPGCVWTISVRPPRFSQMASQRLLESGIAVAEPIEIRTIDSPLSIKQTSFISGSRWGTRGFGNVFILQGRNLGSFQVSGVSPEPWRIVRRELMSDACSHVAVRRSEWWSGGRPTGPWLQSELEDYPSFDAGRSTSPGARGRTCGSFPRSRGQPRRRSPGSCHR